jgi:hypothetical protein
MLICKYNLSFDFNYELAVCNMFGIQQPEGVNVCDGFNVYDAITIVTSMVNLRPSFMPAVICKGKMQFAAL